MGKHLAAPIYHWAAVYPACRHAVKESFGIFCAGCGEPVLAPAPHKHCVSDVRVLRVHPRHLSRGRVYSLIFRGDVRSEDSHVAIGKPRTAKVGKTSKANPTPQLLKGNFPMKNLILRSFVKLHGLRRDIKGQDLIEYALMAGFVAVAAGAIMPNVASGISTIFSKVLSVVTAASAIGG